MLIKIAGNLHSMASKCLVQVTNKVHEKISGRNNKDSTVKWLIGKKI